LTAVHRTGTHSMLMSECGSTWGCGGGVSLLRCQAARVSGAGEVVMGGW